MVVWPGRQTRPNKDGGSQRTTITAISKWPLNERQWGRTNGIPCVCVCMPKLLHCPLSLSLKARRTRPISPLLHQGMTISRQCQWNWIRPNCPHPLSNTYRNRPLGNYTICITSLCPWCARHQLNCRCALKKCATKALVCHATSVCSSFEVSHSSRTLEKKMQRRIAWRKRALSFVLLVRLVGIQISSSGSIQQACYIQQEASITNTTTIN